MIGRVPCWGKLALGSQLRRLQRGGKWSHLGPCLLVQEVGRHREEAALQPVSQWTSPRLETAPGEEGGGREGEEGEHMYTHG